MTDCAELSAFVEKLHDLEATAAEKVAAEAHLQKCASCRSHFEFLERLSEESRAMTFPKPPESYWEHLPRKVLERLDSEERRPSGFFGFLFAPSSLRWAALGATLVLVAAVGVSLLREDWKPEPAAAALAPRPAVLPPSTEPVRSAERPAALAPAAPAPQPERRARSNAESEVAPSMARDEAAEFVSRPESDERVESALAAGAPAEPAVSVAASDEHHQAVAKESAAMRESANRYPSAAPAARLSRGCFRRLRSDAPEGRRPR